MVTTRDRVYRKKVRHQFQLLAKLDRVWLQMNDLGMECQSQHMSYYGFGILGYLQNAKTLTHPLQTMLLAL